jgi:heat shock protein HtpX
MIRALSRLGGLTPGALPKSFEASGISGGGGISAMFATHPPINARINALQNLRVK